MDQWTVVDSVGEVDPVGVVDSVVDPQAEEALVDVDEVDQETEEAAVVAQTGPG